MSPEEMLIILFALTNSLLSFSDGLGAEFFGALLEELQGAHLRIAATNVSAKTIYLKHLLAVNYRHDLSELYYTYISYPTR